MKEFDKIIGYEHIKKELIQIADMFKNYQHYEKLGADYSQGVLLHGNPGVGKSLMATSLIEATGLKSYICRKDAPDGEFVNKIKNTFKEAKENAPSIVYLDDMDKFANGDERHPDAEEYVTVQSCIDDVKNANVFVVATANRLRCLPESLLRAGRFSKRIFVDIPTFEESKDIIAHYLKNKEIDSSIDIESIAKIMCGSSCAELETIIKEAAIYAGFERADRINMKHFIEAVLRIMYAVPLFELNSEGKLIKNAEKIAYHEAGHTLIQEILCPGSVALVSLYESKENQTAGFTKICFANTELYRSIEHRKLEVEILVGFGGAAATEQKFGEFDLGARSDFEDTFQIIHQLNEEHCLNGLDLYDYTGKKSDSLLRSQETAASIEMGRYFRKAKKIIAENMDKLEKIANELLDKKLLLSSDISNILR